MKLYHWTRPGNLIGIATTGLEPKPPYDDVPHITAGQSAVWLSERPSRELDAADLEHVRAYGWDASRGLVFGDASDIRLTVKFNSTNRRHL